MSQTSDTNALIFGKDTTERVVSVEPGTKDKCILFVQRADGGISKREVPMSHWILYTEKYSDKMQELAGDQPFKYLMEYDNYWKYDEVLKASRMKRMENFICRDPKEAFMVKNGVTYYKGLKVKDVSVLSFDLEHTYGIGDKLKKDGKLLLISNTYRDSVGNISKRLFAYDEFKSEKDMISEWCSWVRKMDPSVMVGHNVFGHDFKVLEFASRKHVVDLLLGRDGSAIRFDSRTSHKRKDGSQSYEYNNAHIYGREIVDTFFLAITYDIGRMYESYGLKQIIKQSGLEKENRAHYDASKIWHTYQNPDEWVKIKHYAMDDADDALAVYDLMVAPFFYSTQCLPRSLQHVINSATGGQLNSMMVRAYLQNGHSIAKASDSADFEGGISDGFPGVHKNVWKIDVSGMYPSIIRQLRIFDHKKDPKGYFLRIIEHFADERDVNKRLAKETGDGHYKNMDATGKVFVNSGFGFLGASKLNYNSPQNAALITRTGREILKRAVLWATGREYEIKNGNSVCDSVSEDT